MSVAEKVLLLICRDITPDRAERAASVELVPFSLDDITRILDCLSALPNTKGTRDICGPTFNLHVDFPLWSRTLIWIFFSIGITALAPLQAAASAWLLIKGKRKAIWEEIPRPTWQLLNIYYDAASYVKPPGYLVQRSIDQHAALCVNRNGQFKILKEHYSVMSHVWQETMGWQRRGSWGAVDLSLRKKGIARGHFLKFFDRCEAEWLWVDLIAMPEVLEDMSETEKAKTEVLRNGVINCLRDIYTNADRIVVIDTTMLRLRTRSPLDVAVCLCMSFWMMRVWTLTEAWLAKKVMIKTEDSMFNLDEVIQFLGMNVLNDQSRYHKLLWRLCDLRDGSVSGYPVVSTMTRAYHGNDTRRTNIQIDCARALFPLYDMKWQAEWTVHQGLAAIIDEHPEEEEMMYKYCSYHEIDFDIVRQARSPK